MKIVFSDMGKPIHLWALGTIIFLVVTEGGNADPNHCASPCSCDGLNIDCSSKDLYNIPDFTIIQIYVHAINFSDNEIETLATSNFIHSRLVKLQELQLDGNSIYDIEETTFNYLPNLTYLDISNNLLESVSNHMVEKNTKLRQLNLAKNMFNLKAPKLISQSIEILDLSECKISHIDERHVKHLPKLKVLHLSANALSHIQHHIFDHLPLTVISLSYNYWKCNCDSLRLFHHLVHQNITIGNNIQCLHENNAYEDLTDLGEPICSKKFCIDEEKEKGNGTHQTHHRKHHIMSHQHKEVEKHEDGGFNQNCAIFTGAIVGVVIVSLIASIVAWKITTNKKIKPIDHINREQLQRRLIRKV